MTKENDQLDISLFYDLGLFEVNPNKLIEEWVRQGRLMRHAGSLLAQARRRVSKFKRQLKHRGAKLMLAISQCPSEYGCPSKARHIVEAAILLDNKYMELQVKLEYAEYFVDEMDSAVTSLVDKRKGLENGVVLHGQEYFADTRIPKQGIDDGWLKAEAAKTEGGKGIKVGKA